jgi:hypothetical protein
MLFGCICLVVPENNSNEMTRNVAGEDEFILKMIHNPEHS